MHLSDADQSTVNRLFRGKSMGSIDRWRYATASTAAGFDGDIAVVKISGIVTPATSLQILNDNAAWLAKHEPQGQIARYDGAAMAIDAESLLANASIAVARNSALECPTALIVCQDHLELFQNYSILMGRAGIVRAAFSDHETAHRWICRRAARHQEWLLEHAQRARSAPTS